MALSTAEPALSDRVTGRERERGRRGDSEWGKLEIEMMEGQRERPALKGFQLSLGGDRVMQSGSLSSLPPPCGDFFLSHLKTDVDALKTEHSEIVLPATLTSLVN